MKLAFGSQSLPTMKATLCDPGWQRQSTIDHNLYTKYLETGRLTLTRELKSLFTTQLNTTRDDTYTLYPTMTSLHYMATLSSPSGDLLCHGMARGRGTPLFIGLHGSFCVVMCPPYTLLYISRVFSIFILSYKYLSSK